MIFCGTCNFHKTKWFNETSICKHPSNKIEMISYRDIKYKNNYCELVNEHNNCEYYKEKYSNYCVSHS